MCHTDNTAACNADEDNDKYSDADSNTGSNADEDNDNDNDSDAGDKVNMESECRGWGIYRWSGECVGGRYKL